MLQTWDRQYPGRIETMFSAMQILPSRIFVIRAYLILKG
ncbi:C32 tRNA thiolase [Actinobacillus equuli]|nr:C32 tRNA thiolase [Actinobacillus equuli]